MDEEAKLNATSINKAFACTIKVTCVSGKHNFGIVPEQEVCTLANNKEVNSVDAPDSEGANNEKKEKDVHAVTYRIENYTINIYAHLMI